MSRVLKATRRANAESPLQPLPKELEDQVNFSYLSVRFEL